MADTVTFDSETLGLTGPMVLLQYQINDQPIKLWDIWLNEAGETRELIEYIARQNVVGFNLTYDWFHLTKIYNLLTTLSPNAKPIDHIDAIVEVDEANYAYYCLRPRSACDVMLQARQDKYQHVMGRDDIYIRKVPTDAADELKEYLEENIKLPDICFAKSSKGYQWRIQSVDGRDDVVNLVLQFNASGNLASLAKEVLNKEKLDWPIPPEIMPAKDSDLSWKPYGQHGSTPWRSLIEQNIEYWRNDPKAREYGKVDVELTYELYRALDCHLGDDNSMLACAVGAARWKGFAIDHNRVKVLTDEYQEAVDSCEVSFNSPVQVKEQLHSLLDPAEKLLVSSVDAKTLKALKDHSEAGELCTKVLAARKADKRLGILNRLNKINALHPDFKIFGTKSSRSSGGSEEGKGESINPQGIPREKQFRSCFPLAYSDELLIGGDATSYEIAIMADAYGCESLKDRLKEGLKYHALMGEVWLNVKYDDALNNKEIYDKLKATNFAYGYGGQEAKVAETLGVTVPEARAAMDRLKDIYPEIIEKRNEVELKFCSMRQPGGVGTNVEWHDPDDSISTMFGFKRYFTLENQVCHDLYNISQSYRSLVKGEVDRHRDPDNPRLQSYTGAIKTALFAAAFNIQAKNMRAAVNHIVQGAGAHMTKRFQAMLNEIQPPGVHPYYIRLLQVHDELMAVCLNEEIAEETRLVRDQFIRTYREYVELLDWEWDYLDDWSDK